MADEVKRCYICGRTEEEVADVFYTEYRPEEDEPLMEKQIGLQWHSLYVCIGCRDLIVGMISNENDTREIVAEQMSETISNVLEPLISEKERISELF